MGNPSDGKIYDPDVLCKECSDILIGDEVQKKICTDCERTKKPLDTIE